MPWTTPPVFSYNYPLLPSDLNIIRDDLLYLYGELFNTTPAMIELWRKVDQVGDGEKTALILWIDHKADNLYYRLRVQPQKDDMECRLRIKYYDTDGNLKGTHTEDKSLPSEGTWYLFTNSDSAVDISGWSLSVDTIYKVLVTVEDTVPVDDDYYIEIHFLYEQ